MQSVVTYRQRAIKLSSEGRDYWNRRIVMRRTHIAVVEGARRGMRRDQAALHLTLKGLFDRYTTEGKHLPDGSPKTERYLDHVQQTGRYLRKFFGSRLLVNELTPDRVHDYVVWRRNGGASG